MLEIEIQNREDKILQLNEIINEKEEKISLVDADWIKKLEIQRQEYEQKMVELRAKLSHHSEEIVEGIKKELNDAKMELLASEKSKNKVIDEKLKIEEIIDKQIEQVEYWTNKANKLEDELALRKQIEESVTNNLKMSEEQIRILKLEKDERVLKSFGVKLI